MAIKQLSVYVENRQGKLAELVKTIVDAGINIRAMSIADTKEFGILRLIVEDADKAKAALTDSAIVNITDVVAVKMDDKVGALYDILKVLGEAGIDVDYMYAFTGTAAFGAYVVIRVDNVAQAEAALAAAGAATLSEEEMKAL